MHLTTKKLTGIVASLGVGGVAIAMIGTGVGANFVQSAEGNAHISTGTFNCSLSSTDPDVNIYNNGHSANVTLPAIESSAAGSNTFPLTVSNTGSIPLVVNWGVTTSGSVFDSGAFSFAPVQQNLKLTAGQAHTYHAGVSWTTLGNADLGRTGTVTYSASCTEPNTNGHPNVTFWTQGGGTAAWANNATAVKLALPAGAPSTASAVIQLNNQSKTLPSTEPTFSTDNYNAGSPRWLIQFSNGEYVFGYPSSSNLGANNWEIHGTSGYVPWSTVTSQLGSATVVGVSIVMDTDQPATTDTITAVQYNGTTLF